MSSEKFKLHVDQSPFGDSGTTYEGMLGVLNHLLLQLKSYRKIKKTQAERDYLETDIAAYEEIINSGSETNAQVFIKTKQEDRLGKVRKFKNNRDVINFLKETGKWELK